jgi:nucleoside-diphosphate-sugar epimerase
MDDSAARREWGWQPRYDLAAMTADMIEHIAARVGPAPVTVG